METPEQIKQESSEMSLESQKSWEGIKEELSALSPMESLSGKEDAVREYVMKRMQELGVGSSVDAKGNVWVRPDSPESEILLCAHMDKIGPGAVLQESEGGVTGRLDDSLGMSMILGLFREGYRPSALFTVEEESHQETTDAAGQQQLVDRELPGGIYNAGARFAVDQIYEGTFKKPKLTVVIDVSAIGKAGDGPFIYTAPMHFRFPSEPLKFIAKLLPRINEHARFMEGYANDAVEFSFLRESGAVAIEVPINNYHSSREVAQIKDIQSVTHLLQEIIKAHKEIPSVTDIPSHLEDKKGPFHL